MCSTNFTGSDVRTKLAPTAIVAHFLLFYSNFIDDSKRFQKADSTEEQYARITFGGTYQKSYHDVGSRIGAFEK